MAFPYALDAIGWKTYMINGAWDVLEVAFLVYFWIETKGKTLEEIDGLFDGTKHSDVPDLTMIKNKEVDVGEVLVRMNIPGQDKTPAVQEIGGRE